MAEQQSRGLSDNSVRGDFQTIRALASWAARENYRVDPTLLRLRAPKVAQKEMETYSAEQQHVEAADYVVRNRVICCYPDIPRLTAAAADRVRHTLVPTFPNSRWWTRLGLTIVNFGFRVARLEFRIFLHRPELILAAAEKHGLKTTLNHRGLLWQVAALDRPASSHH